MLLPPFSADPLDDPVPIDEPLDLEDVVDSASGLDAAVEGVVLVHEQTWRRKGLALGHLLHSLTLAPGEATRIAMQDWTHSIRGTVDESTLQQDTATSSEHQSRALQEVTAGTAFESQHGFSEAAAAAHSVQAGLSMLGFSMAAAASSSIATTATSSDALRTIGTRQNHDVHVATEQNAEAARTRRATVVREVVESGSSQASTRVVANYNHMHALTVLYFEVVEVYDVETTITSAKPCVFVPMALKDGGWLLARYPTVLAAAADAGMTGLGATIRGLPANLPLRREPPVLTSVLQALNVNLATAQDEVSDAVDALAPVLSNATGLSAMAGAGIPGTEPTLIANAQMMRDQARSAGEAVRRALTAVTAARDTVVAIPVVDLTPQARLLLTGATDDLSRAITAATAMAADLLSLTRVAVRSSVRIEPPPPLPPTSDELRQMGALATGVVAGTAETARGALTATRQKLDAVPAALPPPPDTSDATDVVERIVKRIDEYREYFNQVVWSEILTPRIVHLLLRDRIYYGEMLNDVLDPTPVAIIGNMVGFTTTSGTFIARRDNGPTIDMDDTVVSEMALPTGGVFAEAVLGQAVAAERIDLTRFWNWQDSPAPLLPTEIRPVDLARTPGSIDLSGGRLDPSAVSQRVDQPLPTATGTADVLAALREQGMFRDAGGLEAAKEVALKAMDAASSGSKDAAQQATQSFKDFAALVENVAPMVMTGGASTLLGGIANNVDDVLDPTD